MSYTREVIISLRNEGSLFGRLAYVNFKRHVRQDAVQQGTFMNGRLEGMGCRDAIMRPLHGIGEVSGGKESRQRHTDCVFQV